MTVIDDPVPVDAERVLREIARAFQVPERMLRGEPAAPTGVPLTQVAPRNQINQHVCKLRGPGIFGEAGWLVFRSLQPGQLLWLKREPTNPADPLAVQVQTLEGDPCGYVARETAARIATDLDRNMLAWKCQVVQLPYIQLDRK